MMKRFGLLIALCCLLESLSSISYAACTPSSYYCYHNCRISYGGCTGGEGGQVGTASGYVTYDVTWPDNYVSLAANFADVARCSYVGQGSCCSYNTVLAQCTPEFSFTPSTGDGYFSITTYL